MSSATSIYALDASTVLTDEQVQCVLRADHDGAARLCSWRVVDFTEKGDNYATVVTAVKVVFVLEGEERNASYFVKINPKMGFVGALPGFSRGFFEKESEFYGDILPLLNTELQRLNLPSLSLPKYHYADLKSHNEAIFMEDLRPRGFQLYDRTKGLDATHTTLIVQELARLHAASLLLQARTPDTDLADRFPFLKKDFQNFAGDQNIDVLGVLVQGGCEMAEALLPRYKGYSRAVAWAARAKDNATQVFSEQVKREAPFEVICHGDCWNGNVLFRYDAAGQPVEVVLVDLQLARVASPATDLAYLLYTSVDGPVRKAHTDDFLSAYYVSLESVLSAAERPVPFNLPQLRQEYERKQEYGLLFACMSVLTMLSSSDEIPDFGSIKQEDVPRLREEYRIKNLEKMDSDPRLHSRYLSLFDNFKDK